MSSPTTDNSLTRRITAAEISIVAIGILVAVLVTFEFVVTALDTPRFIGTWDAWLYFGPNQFFLDYSLHHGEFPLWNPLIFCGTPFAANPQIQLMYPPNLLRSLLTFDPTPLRTHITTAIYILIHVIVAGTGVYCLSRYHRLRRPAACVAVVTMLFNWMYVMSINTLYVWTATVAWVPWIVLLAFKALDAKKVTASAQSALAAGLMLALCMMGGYPQFSIYIALAVVTAAVPYALLKDPGTYESCGPNLGVRIKRVILVLSLMSVVGALGSSAVSIPAKEFVDNSTRAKDCGLTPETRGSEEDPARRLFQNVVRHPIVGMGACAILLLASSMLRRPSRHAVAYATMLYIFVDFSLGPPYPCSTILALTTDFTLSHYWQTYYLFGFPVAMLAAQGTETLWNTPSTLRGRQCRTIVIGLFGALLIFYQQYEDSTRFGPTIWNLAPPILLVTLLLYVSTYGGPNRWQILVPVLVFLELLSWNWRYIPTRYTQECQPYPYTLDTLRGQRQFWANNSRLIRPFLLMNVDMYDLRAGISGYDPLMLSRSYRLLAPQEIEGVYSRGIDSSCVTTNQRVNLFLKRQAWLAREYVHGGLPDKASLFPAATTVFLPGGHPEHVEEIDRGAVIPSSVSDSFERVDIPTDTLDSSRQPRVLESPPGETRWRFPTGTLPAAHAALRIRYRANFEGIFVASATNTDSGEVRSLTNCALHATDEWIELPLPDGQRFLVEITVPLDNNRNECSLLEAYVASDRADEGNRLRVVKRSANRAKFHVSGLDGHRILVFAEASYPGWHAYVDGRRATILDANDALMAVELSPGDHDIEFVFLSWRTYGAVIASVLAWVIVGAALFILGRVQTR